VIYDGAVFGLFDRKARAEAGAKKKELTGDLTGAAERYLEAERFDQAARVLLLAADAERDPDRRMVLCAQAARVGEGTPEGDEARRRKALLGFDLVRAAGGRALPTELSRAGAELEACGEHQAAAAAYALAGDTEAEIRVLEEAGDIDALEDRLQASAESARKERDRAQLLRRMRDMDAIAERRNALREARAWLDREDDEQIRLEASRIESRLLRGPVIDLEVYGMTLRYVLGGELTVGRARADIEVPSTAVSRQHLRLFRRDGRAVVDDLDTRNGTLLAGARIDSLPVGEGLDLVLAGQIACRLAPLDAADPESAIVVDVAGTRYVAPLGPLRIAGWTITDAHDGGDRFVLLRTLAGRDPPHLGSYRLGPQIELCLGDRLSAERGGEVVLAVPVPEGFR
jgi:hypothetical protein